MFFKPSLGEHHLDFFKAKNKKEKPKLNLFKCTDQGKNIKFF